ncbi:winged helix-turn-helix transcriptional regulator [Pendulispora albinea]|uniref:Helix-turn-helix transcriptional regulator n=1 Tax=Pendulispora albinea TaxID=2741071 RepID=A0ABZ2M534_9BACT
MTHSTHGRSQCPTDLLLATLSGPWTMHIVWTLFEVGPGRFGALKRRIPGISSRLLTERLRMLEAQGFVHRHEEKTVPPQVTYAATERLQRLCSALEALGHVADEWYAATPRPAARREPPSAT